MNELVQEFIDKKKIVNAEKRYQKLIQYGFYTVGNAEDPKEYYDEALSPIKNYDDWVDIFYQYNTVTCEYHKKIPIDITDEEYEQICLVTENDDEKQISDDTPLLSGILYFIAYTIYIIGFILGFLIPGGFILVWPTAFVSGSLFLALAQILKSIKKIENKLNI